MFLGRTDAPNIFWMMNAEFGRRPDDHRDIALPSAALVAMSDKVAYIVDFLAVVRQEDDKSILILHAPDNSIDDIIIIEHGIVVLRPNLTGCRIIPDAARLIRRRKARKRSGITPLEILMRPHQVHDNKVRLRLRICPTIAGQSIIQQRQDFFVIALRQVNRMGQMARERLLIAARGERPPDTPIEARTLLIG